MKLCYIYIVSYGIRIMLGVLTLYQDVLLSFKHEIIVFCGLYKYYSILNGYYTIPMLNINNDINTYYLPDRDTVESLSSITSLLPFSDSSSSLFSLSTTPPSSFDSVLLSTVLFPLSATSSSL